MSAALRRTPGSAEEPSPPSLDLNRSYLGDRDDVAALVPQECLRILDVGCSTGALGANLKRRVAGRHVTGIELDPRAAELARQQLDRVIVGSVDQHAITDTLADEHFDCIVFADVLEHLADPWELLRRCRPLLEPKGVVVSSLPNVRHYSTLASLLFAGRWPYRERGIHDRGHLRFFTLRNVVELFAAAGLHLEKVRANYRIIERPHALNKFARFVAVPGLRGFLAFQYLVRARPND